MPEIRLLLGDCLEAMGEIADGSVNLVLTDLPYQVTACKWDVMIPFEPLWAHYRRILNPRGAVVLTASQPFTSMLVMSNPKWFKYCLVWEKEVGTNFLNSHYQPFKVHEDVVVFSPVASSYSSRGTMTYNPQMIPGRPRSGGRGCSKGDYRYHTPPQEKRPRRDAETSYPRSVMLFARETGHHGTQKPVPLMEHLVRTYSNAGETVLDNTFGSCTTGVACINTNRKFIGIEKDEKYFEIGRERVEKAIAARSSCGTTGSSKPDSRGDSLLPLFQIPGTDACDVRE